MSTSSPGMARCQPPAQPQSPSRLRQAGNPHFVWSGLPHVQGWGHAQQLAELFHFWGVHYLVYFYLKTNLPLSGLSRLGGHKKWFVSCLLNIWVEIFCPWNMYFLCHFLSVFMVTWSQNEPSEGWGKKSPVDKYTKDSNGMALFLL